DGVFELDIHRGAVGHVDRDADASRRDEYGVVVHDLASLVRHLHLFAGVAVLFERADLRDEIEGNLVRVDVGLERLALHGPPRRSLQLVDGRASGAGDRLVCGRDNSPDAVALVDGPQRHYDGRRRAIGDREDAFVLLDVLRVDFRYYQ